MINITKRKEAPQSLAKEKAKAKKEPKQWEGMKTMKNLSIKEIIKETNGELIQGNEQYECINFSKDTRSIQEEDCYIGIKGETFDGSKFWKQALDQGASTVIVENVEITEEDKKQYPEKNIIKVENTLEALYKMANYKRNKYNIPVIGITGSVGKTSTKDMVANVVSQKYKTLKSSHLMTGFFVVRHKMKLQIVKKR